MKLREEEMGGGVFGRTQLERREYVLSTLRFCRLHREREREKAAWLWFQAFGDTYSQADFRFLHRQ